jgi:hypothetical protein
VRGWHGHTTPDRVGGKEVTDGAQEYYLDLKTFVLVLTLAQFG